MLKLKPNNKLLQQYVADKTKKIVMLKDISNVQTGLRIKKDRSLDALVAKLKSFDGEQHKLNRQLARPKRAL